MAIKLGVVTYQWAAEWDLPTLIKNCTEAGFDGVEARYTHKHGIDTKLNKAQRADVKKMFDDSPVKFVGPGTGCEYQSEDHGILQRNIDETKQWVLLSAELGGSGVKVRPNKFVKGEKEEKTIERIGLALRECGKFGADHGQEIRVEVHGIGTQKPTVIRAIMDVADHPNVRVCWNSNPGETVNGSLKQNFDLLKNKFGHTCHIHDLYDEKEYPFQELFSLLKKENWDGYCLMECGYMLPNISLENKGLTIAVRFMKYYRKMFDMMMERG